MKLISREIDIVRQLRAVNLAQSHPAYLNFKEKSVAAINCKTTRHNPMNIWNVKNNFREQFVYRQSQKFSHSI